MPSEIKKTILVLSNPFAYNTPPLTNQHFAEVLSRYHIVVYIDAQDVYEKIPIRDLVKYFFDVFIFAFYAKNGFFLWKKIRYFQKSNKWTYRTNAVLIFLFISILKIRKLASVVLYTWSPRWHPLYRYLQYKTFIYDCVDVFSPDQFIVNREWLKTADMILVYTRKLMRQVQFLGPPVKITSPGHHKLHRILTSSVQKNHSVVFAGGISKRIDYRLLYDTCRALPTVNFFFIGETYLSTYYSNDKDSLCIKRWDTLTKLPNVHYLGKMQQKELYRLLPNFNVGIIPYLDYELEKDYSNLSTYPIKLSEYIAAGLHVVTTNLPESDQPSISAMVSVTKNTQEFIREIQKNIYTSYDSPFYKSRRESFIRSTSIVRKVYQIKKLMASIM